MTAFDAIAVGRRVLTSEAQALGLMADGLGEAFVAAVETIFTAKGRVVLTGVGKSGHVGRKIAATLASTGTPSMFVHANEASHGDLGMIGVDDVVLALSKSGEVKELTDGELERIRDAIGRVAVEGDLRREIQLSIKRLIDLEMEDSVG